MSPVGGVGINLAIQDAVAAANILALPLRKGPVSGRTPAPRCRSGAQWPTEMMQAVQVFIQKRVISNVLSSGQARAPPFAVRLLNRFRILRRLPARLVGMGFRPEHVVHARDARD